MYLLSWTGAEEDLGGCWSNGSNMCHHAAASGNLAFLKALVQRGVEFALTNVLQMTLLSTAVLYSRVPAVRFLLEQYRARGREQQDVMRELMEQTPLDEFGHPLSVMFQVIRTPSIDGKIPDQEKLDMVQFLVQEAGANIRATAHIIIDDRSNRGVFPTLGSFSTLHAAAMEGNQVLLDFFPSQCGMAVDTRSPESHLTPLHFLIMCKNRPETELLPVVRWLVGTKGADVTCRATNGATAARLALVRGKTRIYEYLQAQGRQLTRSARRKEEEWKKATTAATMAARMQETEAAMAALLVELEAEEEAAAAKKKEGGGGKMKKKR